MRGRMIVFVGLIVCLGLFAVAQAQDFTRVLEIPYPESDLNNGGVGDIIAGVDLDGDGLLEIYTVNDNWNDTPGELVPRIYKLEQAAADDYSTWNVVWQGTQHNPTVKRTDNGVPSVPAGTLAVIGDLKEMSAQYLVGTTMLGYGVTLTIGIGIPIPILDEEICRYTAVKDEEIWTQVVDYSSSYPSMEKGSLGEVNYARLKSGKIPLKGKEIPTGALSSYSKAKEIANILKEWIKKGEFFLNEPLAHLPGPDTGYTFKPLKER